MISKIASSDVDASSYEIVEKLKEDFDLTTIACKLVSMVSKSESLKGADTIGKSAKEIKELYRRLKYDKDDKNSRRRRGRGRNSRRGNRGSNRANSRRR